MREFFFYFLAVHHDNPAPHILHYISIAILSIFMIEVIWTKFSSFVKVLKLHCQLTNSQDWHFPSLWLLIIAKDSLLAEVSHDSLLSLVFCLVVRDLCLSRESQRSQNALIWLTGISDLLASVSNLSQDPFNRIFPTHSHSILYL